MSAWGGRACVAPPAARAAEDVERTPDLRHAVKIARHRRGGGGGRGEVGPCPVAGVKAEELVGQACAQPRGQDAAGRWLRARIIEGILFDVMWEALSCALRRIMHL